ncbi:MAG: hypothetical protein R2939_17840 [Kofleriaceae bacterium]
MAATPARLDGRQGGVQLDDELPGGGGPPRRLLGEAAREHGVDRGRLARERRHRRHRRRRRAKVRVHELADAGRGERRPPGEQLVRHHRQRVHVGGRAGAVGAPLLRRHVGRRADPAALRGQRAGRGGDRRAVGGGRRQQPRDAEVEHADAPSGALALHHHVVGLEVAMHDAAGVGGVEGVGDRAQHGEGLRRCQRAAGEHLAQRPAVDAIHHQVAAAVVELPEREHVDHARVADLAGGARLAQEARGGGGRRRQVGA